MISHFTRSAAFLFAFITIFLISCGRVIQPQQSDLSMVSSKYPGYTFEMLNEGKVLFESNCNRCHPYKNPSSRTEEEWMKIVPRMSANVNKKLGYEELDQADQDLLLKYLVTMSTVHASEK